MGMGMGEIDLLVGRSASKFVTLESLRSSLPSITNHGGKNFDVNSKRNLNMGEIIVWYENHPLEQMMTVLGALAAAILIMGWLIQKIRDVAWYEPDQRQNHFGRIIRTKDEGAIDFRPDPDECSESKQSELGWSPPKSNSASESIIEHSEQLRDPSTGRFVKRTN